MINYHDWIGPFVLYNCQFFCWKFAKNSSHTRNVFLPFKGRTLDPISNIKLISHNLFHFQVECFILYPNFQLTFRNLLHFPTVVLPNVPSSQFYKIIFWFSYSKYHFWLKLKCSSRQVTRCHTLRTSSCLKLSISYMLRETWTLLLQSRKEFTIKKQLSLLNKGVYQSLTHNSNVTVHSKLLNKLKLKCSLSLRITSKCNAKRKQILNKP